MPNAFAYLALFAWPLVAIVLFNALPRREAVIWTVLGGYLLLPVRVGIDLPLLPPYDKDLAPSLVAILLCLSQAAKDRREIGPDASWLPSTPATKLLLGLYLLGPFLTTIVNGDPVFVGGGIYLRGLTPYDAFSAVLGHMVLILPFFLGRRYLADPEAHRLALVALMIAALAYSVLMLFEIRMSPQLHRWVYGFFPHSFVQQIRMGGFRPVVFLGHGLVVAIFTTMALLAAIGVYRLSRGRGRMRAALAALWLGLVLVLCKSFGALLLALVFVPVIWVLAPRRQMLFASAIGAIVITYPALRGADLIPVQSLIDAAASIDIERAQSLEVRIVNEDRLLARANERPLLGWGIWGRSRVYDSATGEDISVTDGAWVITVGAFGWLGYIAEFGLLTAPFLLFLRRRSAVPAATAALAVVLAVNLLDLIPNSSLSPLTWMFAGGLLGWAERRPAAVAPESRLPVAGPRQGGRRRLV